VRIVFAPSIVDCAILAIILTMPVRKKNGNLWIPSTERKKKMRPLTPTTKDYEKDRLASVIAEIVSGVREAIPEQDDFILANEVYDFIEKKIN
jgi:hypothetical protein